MQYVIEEITKFGYKKEDFRKLHERGLKLQMIDIYKEEGPEYAEEVFSYNKPLLTMIANMMHKDKHISKQYYLSFCMRHPEIISYLEDKTVPKQLET